MKETPTMLTAVHEGTLVIVHSAKPPSDEEWDRYISHFGPDVHAQLVLTMGGGPSPSQRKRASAAGGSVYSSLGRPVPKTAVVSPSAAMRALVALFNWLFPQRFTAHAPEDMQGALAAIGVAVEKRPSLLAHLEDLLRQLKG